MIIDLTPEELTQLVQLTAYASVKWESGHDTTRQQGTMTDLYRKLAARKAELAGRDETMSLISGNATHQNPRQAQSLGATTDTTQKGEKPWMGCGGRHDA